MLRAAGLTGCGGWASGERLAWAAVPPTDAEAIGLRPLFIHTKNALGEHGTAIDGLASAKGLSPPRGTTWRRGPGDLHAGHGGHRLLPSSRYFPCRSPRGSRGGRPGRVTSVLRPALCYAMQCCVCPRTASGLCRRTSLLVHPLCACFYFFLKLVFLKGAMTPVAPRGATRSVCFGANFTTAVGGTPPSPRRLNANAPVQGASAAASAANSVAPRLAFSSLRAWDAQPRPGRSPFRSLIGPSRRRGRQGAFH